MAAANLPKLRVPIDKLSRPNVAIVGFTDHRKQALKLDDTWELWSLNELHRYEDVNRFHRWFEIHNRADLEGDAEHLKTLATFDIPVYMQQRWEDIPPSLPFPKEIVEKVAGEYMTSSPAWMLGLAIAMGAKEIGIYGIDMAQDCLAPDTRVLTADLRWARAGDVQAGDTLLGFDERSGAKTDSPQAYRQWRESRVISRSVRKRPSYRIHFEDGTTVVASAGHQWLTFAENSMRWKRTDELVTAAHRKGRPSRVVRVLDVWDEDTSRDAGYLSAAFDGEGCISQHGHRGGNTSVLKLEFAQRENAMANEVRLALGVKGFSWGETRRGGEAGGVATKQVTHFTVKGGRPEIMRFLGSIRPHRLLERFDASKLGTMQRKAAVAVTHIEFLGEVETVGFTTSTRTLVAEGLATHNSEYAQQRPCMEHLIGLAMGRGIPVRMPETSDLLKAVGQYGFSSVGTGFRAKLQERLDWLHKQDNDWLGQIRVLDQQYEQKRAELEAQYRQQREQLLANRWQVYGAIQDVEYWMRSWSIAGDGEAGKPTPDRTKDPRTGITAPVPSGDSKETSATAQHSTAGKAPAKNRIAAEVK